jgi:phosphocarrier protein
MIETRITIINKLGLHARAAAKLVSTASSFGSHIKIAKIEKTGGTGQAVDAKSIMSVMMLAASKGTDIILQCNGNDEQLAADAMVVLINDKFGEGE